MGPPLKAAENLSDHLRCAARQHASMGPPLKAAENTTGRYFVKVNNAGFNGAAAKSSGKYLKNSIDFSYD